MPEHKHRYKLVKKIRPTGLIFVKCECGVGLMNARSNLLGPLTQPIQAPRYYHAGWLKANEYMLNN